MKDFIKHFRIARIHIYITTRRLKNPGRNERLRHNAEHAISRIKQSRYRKMDGRCQVCGQRFSIDKLDMHHIKPVKTYPQLVAKNSNLLMVCRACHLQLHGKAKAQ